jgi:hypothetical protein
MNMDCHLVIIYTFMLLYSAPPPPLQAASFSRGVVTMRCDISTCSSAHISLLVSGSPQACFNDQVPSKCLCTVFITETNNQGYLPMLFNCLVSILHCSCIITYVNMYNIFLCFGLFFWFYICYITILSSELKLKFCVERNSPLTIFPLNCLILHYLFNCILNQRSTSEV